MGFIENKLVETEKWTAVDIANADGCVRGDVTILLVFVQDRKI